MLAVSARKTVVTSAEIFVRFFNALAMDTRLRLARINFYKRIDDSAFNFIIIINNNFQLYPTRLTVLTSI